MLAIDSFAECLLGVIGYGDPVVDPEGGRLFINVCPVSFGLAHTIV